MFIFIILLFLSFIWIVNFFNQKNKLEQMADKRSILDRSSVDYHRKIEQSNNSDYQKGKKEVKESRQQALKAEQFTECLNNSNYNYTWCYISTYIF